jgi:hypothetical protein
MATEQGFDHVDWSYSTARLYQSCPRRFYHRYARSSNQSSGEENQSETNRSPPGAAIGSVVHDCIEAQIERWRRGERLSFQAAQTQATDRLRAYVEANEDLLANEYTDDDAEFNPGDQKRSLIRTAHTHIERFFQVIWPQFSSHTYILHEATRSFTVDKYTVWVRPDLCTRNKDGDFVVTDWKTTSSDPFSEPSVQLLTYALWSHLEYEPELDRILVQLVHTSTGEFVRTRPDEDGLIELKTRIRSDCHDWGTRCKEKDFRPNPATDKCRSCEALDRCESGQSLLKTDDS